MQIAYNKGYQAYWEYLTQEDNPYSIADLANAWVEGFVEARAVDNGDSYKEED